jgi:8-oxo-dGTP diphosphatase
MPDAKQREHPSVTVDIVVVSLSEGRPQVLLIERANPPFEGYWALPGGFVDPHEPLEAAARRELLEETGIEPEHLEQMHTFGDPGRDPRGWTISVAYLAFLGEPQVSAQQPRAGSDAAEVAWFDLQDLPALAFDHAAILAFADQRVGQVLSSGR